MANKIIKGQAWISGDSLVQDQILLTDTGKSSENTVELIANIWDDLTKASGNEYKTNNKGYFFWEVEMTSMEDDNVTVKVNIECPKPKPGLFQEPYDPDSVDSSYAKYWVAKMKTAQENYENEYAIQRKEVVFNGCTYQDQEGHDVELPDYTFNNSDIGDITNLLSLF
jgi:hypothetical protein